MPRISLGMMATPRPARTQRIVASLVSEFGEGLKRVGINGDEILASAPQHLAGLGKIAETIFGRWAAPIQGT